MQRRSGFNPRKVELSSYFHPTRENLRSSRFGALVVAESLHASRRCQSKVEDGWYRLWVGGPNREELVPGGLRTDRHQHPIIDTYNFQPSSVG